MTRRRAGVHCAADPNAVLYARRGARAGVARSTWEEGAPSEHAAGQPSRARAGTDALSAARTPEVAPDRGGGRDMAGYGLLVACFTLVGLSGTLAAWVDAPGSVLLFLRYAIAAVLLGLVFGVRRPLQALRRRDLWPRLLPMGLLDGGSLLAYFYAIRVTGVAVATFLFFTQPVWVALLAPRLLKAPTERLVYVALGVSLVGLGVILAPGFVAGEATLSAAGIAVGLLGGALYALFQLLVKHLTVELASSTIVTLECALDAVVILPLALWQFTVAGVVLTGQDWVASVILGVLCTAVAYTFWVEGVGRVPVQRSSILGFLTPVMAPLFAWAALGQEITVWTAVGGALILAAGALVALCGPPGVETEPAL